jgi:hypothetical protein
MDGPRGRDVTPPPRQVEQASSGCRESTDGIVVTGEPPQLSPGAAAALLRIVLKATGQHEPAQEPALRAG